MPDLYLEVRVWISQLDSCYRFRAGELRNASSPGQTSYQGSWNCHRSTVTPEVSVRECHLARAGREPAVGRRLGVRQACSVL